MNLKTRENMKRPPIPTPSLNEQFLTEILRHGLIEIRALDVQKERRPAPASWTSTNFGYFNNLYDIKRVARELEARALGIYFTVNPVNPDLIARCKNKLKRAKKGDSTLDLDVVDRRWVVFDFDATRPKGVMATDEENDIIKETTYQFITDQRKTFGQPWVIFSGSGYHLYYRYYRYDSCDKVDFPFSELYKHWSTEYPGFDNKVHNPARIMRLPGSWNCKGEPVDGRVYRKCEVLTPGDGQILTSSDLQQFLPKETKPLSPINKKNLKYKFGSTDLVQLFKDQGLYQTSETNQRHAVLCPNRAEHSDNTDGKNNTVIIINKDATQVFHCSHSHCSKFKQKQLDDYFGLGLVYKYSKPWVSDRKKIFEPDEALDILNEKHAVMFLEGRTVVLTESYDIEFRRHKMTLSTRADFFAWYENSKVKIEIETAGGGSKTTHQEIARWWFKHIKRREFEGFIFDPSSVEHKNDCYNLWRGFSCESKEGDCSLYLNHLKSVICNSDRSIFNYVLNWMADAVQNPTTKPGVSIVLRGGQGTGKGTAIKFFGDLFGVHYMQVTNQKHVTGQFNAHLKSVIVLFIDEAVWAGDKKGEGILKALVTEHETVTEMKGRDAFTTRNFIRVLMASDKDWVIPADFDDRRYVVLDVSDEMKSKKNYKMIENEMMNGGYGALLHLLINRDLTNVDIRDKPATLALLENKINSMDTVTRFIYNKLQEGVINKCGIDKFYSEFEDFSQDHYKPDKVIFGKKLMKLFPDIKITRIKGANKSGVTGQYRTYNFPNMSKMREMFCDKIGHEIEWGELIEEDDF